MNNDFFLDALRKLINLENITDITGIIIYGSQIRNNSNDFSDLDVMIIKNKYDTQDCGSSIINNIRVEYFIQDINKLYELVDNEINNNDPSHLTKFATCKIIYDKDNKTIDFINYVKKLYNKRMLVNFDDYDKFSVFSINNRIEDLESLVESDNFYAVYYVTLEKIRLSYSKINGIIDLPLAKIDRIFNNNDYAQNYIASNYHMLPSNDFINIYLRCLDIKDKQLMLEEIKSLYNYCFEKYNFDPCNFHLRFVKNSPFKV